MTIPHSAHDGGITRQPVTNSTTEPVSALSEAEKGRIDAAIVALQRKGAVSPRRAMDWTKMIGRVK